jgi:hypothetical protein
VGNAALPRSGSLRREDERIEGLKAELGTWFGRQCVMASACNGDGARGGVCSLEKTAREEEE